jgi:fatty-acyl-CoA synthase
MRNEGLGSWPARRARKTPHRTALIHGDTTVVDTTAHAYERTTRLAHALRDPGVRRGDRIAYLGPNHPSYLETLFAAGTLGAVFVPLNTRLAGPEIAYQLTDSGAKALVYGPTHAGLVAGLPGNTDVRTYVEVGAEYEELLDAASDEPIDEPVTADDTCIIMYTSGTTGRPKGAMLTHGNLTWNAINVLVDTDLIADERALVSAPLFHTAGLNMLTLPVLLKGGTCVLVEAFDPAATFDLIERHRITFMFGVPTMFDHVARHPRWADADLSSLRILTCGGSPVPSPLIAAYQERGLTFLQGYGMTEASPGTLFLDAEHAVSKAGSAGVPHFFSDVRVVRPDLTPAESARPARSWCVRGRMSCPATGGCPRRRPRCSPTAGSAAGTRPGPTRTGTSHRRPYEGHDHLRRGEHLPRRDRGPAPRPPRHRRVRGHRRPDEKWGEVPRAVVVPREDVELDPDEVLASLAGRLAKYKIPKSVVVADELPRTASGKLLKSRVRKRYGTNSSVERKTYEHHRQRHRRTQEARRQRPRHQ